MAWVTAASALLYTGEDLTEDALNIASGVICLYASVTEDMPDDSISARDRRWLGMATAYQAAWMKPGLLTHRESHSESSADGVRVARRSDSDIMLAPLAARALRNLSWVGTRSVLIPPSVDAAPKGSFINEAGDEYHSWTPRPI